MVSGKQPWVRRTFTPRTVQAGCGRRGGMRCGRWSTTVPKRSARICSGAWPAWQRGCSEAQAEALDWLRQVQFEVKSLIRSRDHPRHSGCSPHHHEVRQVVCPATPLGHDRARLKRRTAEAGPGDHDLVSVVDTQQRVQPPVVG